MNKNVSNYQKDSSLDTLGKMKDTGLVTVLALGALYVVKEAIGAIREINWNQNS